MRQGDDGLFITAADDQTLVFGAEDGFGSSRGIRRFAQQVADNANREAEPNRRRSSPISITIIAALIWSMPGMVCSRRQAPA